MNVQLAPPEPVPTRERIVTGQVVHDAILDLNDQVNATPIWRWIERARLRTEMNVLDKLYMNLLNPRPHAEEGMMTVKKLTF